MTIIQQFEASTITKLIKHIPHQPISIAYNLIFSTSSMALKRSSDLAREVGELFLDTTDVTPGLPPDGRENHQKEDGEESNDDWMRQKPLIHYSLEFGMINNNVIVHRPSYLKI